ncbi:MAG: helicase-associated domain-containing protein, partial [Treponema sp.]|nr:helicase-associated domain-containing protein [Treponema sp.]
MAVNSVIPRIENPLIVQSDRTLLLDVHTPRAGEARSAILPFAELEKSPEHIHTYRITPLSLWNAAGAGFSPDDIITALNEYTRYDIPPGITEGFVDTMARYGKLRLLPESRLGECCGADREADKVIDITVSELPDELFLVSDDDTIMQEIGAARILEKYLTKTALGFRLKFTDRG